MDDAGTGPLTSRQRTSGYSQNTGAVGPGMLRRTIHAMRTVIYATRCLRLIY
jgi:hypothetical protein